MDIRDEMNQCLLTGSSECPCNCVLENIRAYLDEGVDNSYVGTGIEHLVEVGLPVDQFQLVELLIILEEKITLDCTQALMSKATLCSH